MELASLVIVAVATTVSVPVVGALLMFSLMVGAPGAARALTSKPFVAFALSVVHLARHRLGGDRSLLRDRMADRVFRRGSSARSSMRGPPLGAWRSPRWGSGENPGLGGGTRGTSGVARPPR